MRQKMCARVTRWIGAAMAAGLLAVAPASAQTTLTLATADTEVTDTTVRGGTHASSNYGDDDILVTRASSNAEYVRRALLKFDTSTMIPAGSTIASATLTLTVKGGNTSTRRLGAYAVTQSFQEGQATWKIRKSSYAWAVAGGTLGPQYAVATTTATAGSRVAFDVTTLVQDFVSNKYDSRYARIAVVDLDASDSSSYREYYSSESADAASRPRLVVTFGSATASGTTSPSTSTTKLKVLDWNIHHGVGTDGQYDIDRIATWIAKIGPDVVSLNEVEQYTSWGNEDQPARFASLLKAKTGYTWYYTFAQRYDGSTARGQGNLLLSRFPLSSVAGYALSDDRSVAVIRVALNNRLVTIASTHLDEASGTMRVTQMGELKTFLAAFAEPRMVAGDFNAWPGAPEIANMTSSYIDSWAEAKADGTAVAYSGNEAGNTRNSRIDYIFRSMNASELVLLGAQVFDVRDSSGVQPSDHRPVMATFAVR